jgi:hypothetical protein
VVLITRDTQIDRLEKKGTLLERGTSPPIEHGRPQTDATL